MRVEGRLDPRSDEGGEQDAAEPSRSFASDFVRTLGGGVTAGLATGLIVGGLGGRVVMRILAITSAPEATGILTENGNTVGQITLGGTLGLLIFAGVLSGLLGGLAYLGIRRWLPGRGWRQGLLFGLVLLCATGPLVVEPENADFFRLRPRALAVGMFLVLFPLFGLMVAPLTDRLVRLFPAPRAHPRALLPYAVPAVPLMLMFPAFFGVLAIGFAADGVSRSARLSAIWRGTTVQLAGYAAIAAACAFGLVRLAQGIAEIL